MSPEYINGQNLDHTADIYSLGALLYFFLTRRLIFQGNLEVQIAKKEKLDYIDITEVHREIPLYIGSLIKKMIEPKKENRFLSYDSLISELDEILKKRHQNDISAKGSLSAQNTSIFIKSDRKQSPILNTDDVKKETPVQEIPKRKNQIKKTILLLVLISIIYGITQIPYSKNSDTTKSTTEKIPVVDLSNKKSLLPETGNKSNIDSQKLIEFDIIHYSNNKSAFIMSWNHTVMDGRGSGMLIRHLNEEREVTQKFFNQLFPPNEKKVPIFQYIKNILD